MKDKILALPYGIENLRLAITESAIRQLQTAVLARQFLTDPQRKMLDVILSAICTEHLIRNPNK